MLSPRLDGPAPALIFDLDRALIDSRRAWCYAIEEAALAVCGERISAEPLVVEYHHRPWRDAIGIVVGRREQQAGCERLTRRMYERSALKRLLVFEGIGMALDDVRSLGVEMGAISREPHSIARKQVESTGLERFLTALSATPAGEPWDPVARASDCLAFLEREPGDAVYSGVEPELSAMASEGYRCVAATWCDDDASADDAIAESGSLSGRLLRVIGRG